MKGRPKGKRLGVDLVDTNLGFPPAVAAREHEGDHEDENDGERVTLISQGSPVGGFPTGFNIIGSARFGDFTLMGFIFLAVLVPAFLVLGSTVLGEYIYAGGNFVAARLSGVPTRSMVGLVFCVSGALAAFSGIILTSRLRIAQPTAAQSPELDAIAAVVLGGTSLFGGRGGVIGTFFAGCCSRSYATSSTCLALVLFTK